MSKFICEFTYTCIWLYFDYYINSKDAIGVAGKTAKIPGLIAETLDGLAKGKTKVNIEFTGFDEPLERLSIYVKYVVLSFIVCVLFIGLCILATIDLEPKTSTGIPLVLSFLFL